MIYTSLVPVAPFGKVLPPRRSFPAGSNLCSDYAKPIPRPPTPRSFSYSCSYSYSSPRPQSPFQPEMFPAIPIPLLLLLLLILLLQCPFPNPFQCNVQSRSPYAPSRHSTPSGRPGSSPSRPPQPACVIGTIMRSEPSAIPLPIPFFVHRSSGKARAQIPITNRAN